MSEADAKALLYSCIDKIGKDQLKIALISDVSSSKKYISKIIQECFSQIDPADYSTKGDVCEALLHFFLTAISIPSERMTKIGIVELDMVIPSVKQLKSDPDRAIVIQIIRDPSSSLFMPELETVQPNKQNIWAVTDMPTKAAYKIYGTWSDASSFSTIIVDLQSFLAEKKIRGLKLVSD